MKHMEMADFLDDRSNKRKQARDPNETVDIEIER
jgi:hypothetical protein